MGGVCPGSSLPLFDFTDEELTIAQQCNLMQKLEPQLYSS